MHVKEIVVVPWLHKVQDFNIDDIGFNQMLQIQATTTGCPLLVLLVGDLVVQVQMLLVSMLRFPTLLNGLMNR